jgi:hypothetical protein
MTGLAFRATEYGQPSFCLAHLERELGVPHSVGGGRLARRDWSMYRGLGSGCRLDIRRPTRGWRGESSPAVT